MTTNGLLRLHVGSSSFVLPGFENIDRVPLPGVRACDVRLGLPYPDGSCDAIVCSHTLEHLHPLSEVPFVLREFHRVLTPGGIVRIAVPDLAIMLDCYTKGDFSAHAASQVFASPRPPFGSLPNALQFSAIVFGNNSGSPAYDGHQAVWDHDALAWALRHAGFERVTRCAPSETASEVLKQRYADVWPKQSLIVEAVR